MSGLTDRERNLRRVRVLMETCTMDKDQGTPRIAIGINGILLFRVGHLYYGWKTSAAKLWQWNDEIPEVAMWHEMNNYVHRIVFHRDDLNRVCECVLDHGEPVVIC